MGRAVVYIPRCNKNIRDNARLGITGKKDVLDFVQAADQINIALGEDLGEGAVKNIGKLANIFGDDKRMGLKQAMLSTASAINELAQNSSASEGNILDFTTRLSAMAKTAGLTQNEPALRRRGVEGSSPHVDSESVLHGQFLFSYL